MAEITVRALDSALAMEEIQKRLGDDALIISTKRVDGQIEITATDDELKPLVEKVDPLVLSAAFRQDKFSSILDNKVKAGVADKKLIQSQDFYSTINTKILEISEELIKLKHLVAGIDVKEDLKFGTLDKLQMLGFRKATLQKFYEITNESDITEALQKMAKSFVNGKCRHFDETNIYFVTGLPNSGKSTFINKFISLKNLSDEGYEFLSLDDGNKRKLLSTIKNLKNDENIQSGEKKQALVIEETQQDSNFESLLLKIEAVRPDLKISVIRTVAVGHSYEIMMKSDDFKSTQKQYIAFTKLDLCDISVPEISAMLELSAKCMFFSGIDKVTDGAYFAKIDQIESYLLKKLKEEVG
jgi:flagellar biosynthesis GTPase FlhF